MEPLTKEERDQIAWHLSKGFLSDDQAEVLLADPEQGRRWLNQEPPELEAEDLG